MDIETIIEQAEKKQKEIYDKKEKMERIALMGGTFDPIHHGHLVIAEQIRCEYHLDKVVFIPAGIPPHKSNLQVADAKHRYFMTLLATVTNPYFEVSKIEIEDDQVSYTIHTIKKLKKIYPENTELYFITGADAICDLDTWKDVKELLHLCNFIAATRPGLESPLIDEKIEELQSKYEAKIRKMDVPALAISSTDIRRRRKAGQSIKYLVPEPVEYYIYKNGLYR
ncbi:nicotinate-nucleotide adenylyltransferase [Thermotalea metallivorans]|uniref:Probable nicotinate-nucleotide adenylyltransferase n=1 Tax=Thermotalea metallivorans TaxID=520762 RepID=A0A140L916_9FIRM|nr:nicotinate-nucleotide adenylyltransferase [Thermotalea metallivorans]KXG77041.1 putative nicotinate-nucleotide adenylyltransferase [Thermotalea metallivorans]